MPHDPPADSAAVDKSNERVRRMFGEIAPRYDRMNHLLSMNVDRWWRRYAARRLAPKAGEPILDVCTGTGDLALALWRQTGGESSIVGTDFAPQMLSIARDKAQRAGAAAVVEFQEADAQQLPFPDDSFQLVTVAFGLRNVSDTDRGLREMVRVCRPGGTLGILEFTMPRRWPVRPLYGWYFRHVLPRIGQLLARNSSSAYEYLPQSVGQFPEYDQLVDRMKAAGLDQASFTPLTFGVATLYVGRKPAEQAATASSNRVANEVADNAHGIERFHRQDAYATVHRQDAFAT